MKDEKEGLLLLCLSTEGEREEATAGVAKAVEQQRKKREETFIFISVTERGTRGTVFQKQKGLSDFQV